MGNGSNGGYHHAAACSELPPGPQLITLMLRTGVHMRNVGLSRRVKMNTHGFQFLSIAVWLSVASWSTSASACKCSTQPPPANPAHFVLMVHECGTPSKSATPLHEEAKIKKPNAPLCFWLGVEPKDRNPGAVSITAIRYFLNTNPKYRSNVMLFRSPGFYQNSHRDDKEFDCEKPKCVSFRKYEAYHSGTEDYPKLNKWHANIRPDRLRTNDKKLLSSHLYQAKRKNISGYLIRKSYLIHYFSNITSVWIPFYVGIADEDSSGRRIDAGLQAVDLEIEFLSVDNWDPRFFLIRTTGGN